MPVVIASNIPSLQSQRFFSRNTEQLGATFQRLSSGHRINQASDDAAGLAIADSLHSDARLYSVASRNINDGMSVLNVMSGALDNQKQILLRLAEISEQSANGVYSPTQREALNGEYQALVKEFGRIGSSTAFNGISLLESGRGSDPATIALQAGIDGSLESILSVIGADTGPFSGTITTRSDVTDGAHPMPYEGQPDGVVDIDDFSYALLVETGAPTFEQLAAYAGNNIFRIDVVDSNAVQREVLGILAFGDFNSGGQNQASIALYEEAADSTALSSIGGVGLTTQAARESNPLSINLTFSNGATGTAILDFRGLDIQTDNTGSGYTQTSIDFTGVETVSRSLDALDRVHNRLEELGQLQGRFGAIQSRLIAASNVTMNARENDFAAEGRIRDADVAVESANLIQMQILQQASAAVMSQANIQPQLALELL